jgi:hypothetical protein
VYATFAGRDSCLFALEPELVQLVRDVFFEVAGLQRMRGPPGHKSNPEGAVGTGEPDDTHSVIDRVFAVPFCFRLDWPVAADNAICLEPSDESVTRAGPGFRDGGLIASGGIRAAQIDDAEVQQRPQDAE